MPRVFMAVDSMVAVTAKSLANSHLVEQGGSNPLLFFLEVLDHWAGNTLFSIYELDKASVRASLDDFPAPTRTSFGEIGFLPLREVVCDRSQVSRDGRHDRTGSVPIPF
jgi:hypothetical protein